MGRVIRTYGLELHIYADDTQIYVSIKPVKKQAVDECVINAENCVLAVQKWMTINMLKLNAEKTEVMVIGSRQQLAKFNLASIIIADSSVPIQTLPVRNLGVFFYSGMTMDSQVAQLTKACNIQLVNIARVRSCLNTEATKKLVSCLVTSRMDYGNALLCGLPAKLTGKLQRVQNTAARVITGVRKYDHITPKLRELHWLPVVKRIDYKILVLVYKALHDQAPSYISAMLIVDMPQRHLRSASHLRLVEPRVKCSTFGGRAFCNYAPKMWNSLPEKIRLAASLDVFKKLLKTHLFHQAYA